MERLAGGNGLLWTNLSGEHCGVRNKEKSRRLLNTL